VHARSPVPVAVPLQKTQKEIYNTAMCKFGRVTVSAANTPFAALLGLACVDALALWGTAHLSQCYNSNVPVVHAQSSPVIVKSSNTLDTSTIVHDMPL
jgi:hypothetical protein